ncbi:MAG: ribosome silencing factor [Gammaproteobacteria bacterium]|nr:ribosome silencing factor [Gammaproteobacteria bacterium]
MSNSSSATLESAAIKKLVIEALEALKAEDIVVLDVRDRASFTDTMIFASGNSSRHVISIADSVIEASKAADLPPLGVEGETVGEWVLVDLGDAIVHVMLPDTRTFYELEKLWSEAQADTAAEQS